MKILAFESSCDETAAAVVEDGRTVLSNVVSSQIEMHKLYGGVVPEIASRKHVEAITDVAERAVERAGIGLHDISAVAATCAPGLIGALLVGVSFAKSAALALDVPFIPVHHIRAHIAANYIAFPELEPPFTALSVSGGTSLIADVADYTDMRIIGATRDDAAGEAFDKIARVLGYPYPGGAAIDKLAQGGDCKKYKLPRADIKDAPFDFSFSGLKTAAINIIHNAEQKGEPIDKPALAASLCAAVCGELVPKAVAAAKSCGRKVIAAAGGVAANSVLRAELLRQAGQSGIKVYFPPLDLCGDNGAMVGAQAYYEYLAGNIGELSQNAFATLDISKNIRSV